MARCVTFTVARIHVEIGEILHIFSFDTQSMGDRGSKKAYTGPRTVCLLTKFGFDRSIVVGYSCGMTDRQTDRRQTGHNYFMLAYRRANEHSGHGMDAYRRLQGRRR